MYQLAHRYGRALLIERARAVDLGLDLGVLAEMMTMLDRYEDEDLPIAPDTGRGPACLLPGLAGCTDCLSGSAVSPPTGQPG
ncbi:hypothetical protein ACU610_12695 [Geodermatophilus sp. URMC 61]|uniref:hypothetical protein n=1 Tax=Geodermatophilus sp. URMC 61 TaxID=3423411 RepID=UPI00406CCECC